MAYKLAVLEADIVNITSWNRNLPSAVRPQIQITFPGIETAVSIMQQSREADSHAVRQFFIPLEIGAIEKVNTPYAAIGDGGQHIVVVSLRLSVKGAENDAKDKNKQQYQSSHFFFVKVLRINRCRRGSQHWLFNTYG